MKHNFEIVSVGSPQAFAADNNLPINEQQLSLVRLAKSVLTLALDGSPALSGRNFDKKQIHIAGGAISRIFRNDTSIGDIDVYGQYGRPIATYLSRLGGKVKISGANTIQVEYGKINYNFILNTVADPDIILNLFDINMCRLAMSIHGENVFYHPKAIDDLQTKTISFSGCPHQVSAARNWPMAQSLRVKKYEDMGYPLNLNDFLDALPLGADGDKEPDLYIENISDEDKYAIMYACLEDMQKHQSHLMALKTVKVQYAPTYSFAVDANPVEAWQNVRSVAGGLANEYARLNYAQERVLVDGDLMPRLRNNIPSQYRGR